eukprot:59385-Pleurochrysis_carterae.AAC.5
MTCCPPSTIGRVTKRHALSSVVRQGAIPPSVSCDRGRVSRSSSVAVGVVGRSRWARAEVAGGDDALRSASRLALASAAS